MTDATTRSWSTAAMVRAVGLVFLFLILLRFLWVARSIFIVTFLGLLFGLALSSGASWLHHRFRVKRAFGAIGITLVFLALMVGIGAMIAPTLRDQATELQEKLPQSLDQIDKWLGRQTQVLAQTVAQTPGQAPQQQQGQQQEGARQADQTQQQQPGEPQRPDAQQQGQGAPQQRQTGEQQQQPSGGQAAPTREQQQQQQKLQRSLREQLAQPLRQIARYLFPFISSTFAAIAALVLIIFIAMYIASDPDLYRRGVLHMVPQRKRQRAGEVLDTIGDSLRRWLIARLLAMVAIGTITTVLLMLLKVRAAVALGVVAGLFEFIPFFGPIASAVPAIGIALLDSPQKALWVALVFVGIQQIEGNLITPLLLKKRVDIPPVLTIVAVGSLGAALGIGGMLIAEPLLVVILIAVKMLYVEDVVGDEVTESDE